MLCIQDYKFAASKKSNPYDAAVADGLIICSQIVGRVTSFVIRVVAGPDRFSVWFLLSLGPGVVLCVGWLVEGVSSDAESCKVSS